MKTAYTIPGLLLLVLLLVCVTNTNGAGAFYDTCRDDSECSFDHSNCFKSDECTLGKCYCDHAYAIDNNVCKLLKKIGETCDSSTDKCYSDDCTGNTCVCENSQPASGDKKNCGRAFGESCASNSECDNDMKCLSGACACETTKKHVVINAYVKMEDMCAHQDATLDVVAGGSCNNDGSSSTGKYCRSDLYCGTCPEETSSSNKKCISGASDQSASKLAFVVLVTAAIFLNRH